MAVSSNDQNVKAAVKAVAESLGVSEGDALKVLVSRGAQDYAKTMGAQAYTQGSGVNSAPASKGAQSGQIGHELTHVIQQSTRQIEAANNRAAASGGAAAKKR